MVIIRGNWEKLMKMKKIMLMFLKYAAITLVLMVGGCTIGYAVSYNGPNPDMIQWEQMPSPPETPVRIIELGGYGGDRNSITIAAASGAQYTCCGPWPSTWTRVTYDQTRYGPTCDQIQSTLMDKLPAKPVDCAFISQFEWVTEQYYAALLPDGSIWRWHYYHGLGNIVNGMVYGALVGLVIGVGWAVYQWIKNRRQVKTLNTPPSV
jgi:hypothetical protein